MNDRLTFTRQSERRTSDDKLRDQLEFIASRALTSSRNSRGWGYEIGPIEAQLVLSSWLFTSWIRFYRVRPLDPDREAEQLTEIHSWAAATGHNARFANKPWTTKLVDQPKTIPILVSQSDDLFVPEVEEILASSDPVDPLTDEEMVPLASISKIKQNGFYDHLFG